MRTSDYNCNYVDGYLKLISFMSIKDKKELIKRISETLTQNESISKDLFLSSFGAWKSKESADEINAIIRNSRIFKRKLEAL